MLNGLKSQLGALMEQNETLRTNSEKILQMLSDKASMEQSETLLANSEKILQMLSSKASLKMDMEDALSDKKVAVTYAYRYLLNREPENIEIVKNNTMGWQELREVFLQSQEYKLQNPVVDMPYRSLQVEGITYFYNRLDRAIPERMYSTGINWAKEDIDNFIDIADRVFYYGQTDASTIPETGIFLDIGGNIGTTSIYCKLKLKPGLHFIGFEPVKDNATLFAINSVINGINHDVRVERIALSNETDDNQVIAVLPENMGGSFVAELKSAETLKQEGRIIENIYQTTLDEYLSANQISGEEIKYLWIDVEGHEPEVLEGAAGLLKEYRIPSCIEFNQKYYKDAQCYEKMLKMLENYFDYFVTCHHAAKGETCPRPINEVSKLWEEFNHESCDLILF